ncbi:MAG: ThiF family adenylyltransferase [Methylobacter sp.]|nr:ThiF family adenylyltransferase [Methylobacter sp.]MDP2426534.1 ThiF family adenylyltransferase [Methylobacter sp.]MDP3053113.1 ThiF family adenylyltransferase [Methylobacter sp.]MDP3361371.1 ThiF family adenylyltransferase [Methylobacter sp.]MDZ4217810.1 ThiF family adenylyltransferase [Methylobacter sp.]
MNYQEIVRHLCDQGYLATLENVSDLDCLVVSHDFEGGNLKLIHFCVDEIDCLPTFFLGNFSQYGNLAHVLPLEKFDLGSVCVGDQDSVSVNFEQPKLAFQESLERHINLLTKTILEVAWNTEELLREFYANWLRICDDSSADFICAASGDLEEVQVFSPVSGRKWGFGAKYLGITHCASSLAEFSYIAQQDKNRSIAGEGFIIPLNNLKPAPTTSELLGEWYLQTIKNNYISSKFEQKKGKRFWLIFNAQTPSGRTWFGIQLSIKGNGKKSLPKNEESLKNWSISPIRVKIFNKEKIMPRSGANLGLEGKSVLMVGCGSVGGEIVYKLGAAGIGNMVLCDPDIYTMDNIYRHVLSDHFLGCNKAIALSLELDSKFPWIKTQYEIRKLLDLRNTNYLNSFDLIVIAIGSPTHERLFHDFLVQNHIKTPVINTWLEGYGIGGHAVLDLQNANGCLRCAYVDLQTGARGLSSNLNFLETDQNLTVNHAGCGELFLPYNSVSAAQTALIATNLAIGTLLGKITSSSKVSWKGDCSDVVSRGFSVTHRYTAFDKSLQILPLYNEDCDICHG